MKIEGECRLAASSGLLVMALALQGPAHAEEHGGGDSQERGQHAGVSFAAADKNQDRKVNRGEAAVSDMVDLMQDWQQADADGDGVLDKQEYQSAVRVQGDVPAFPKANADGDGSAMPEKVIGRGELESPETVLFDGRSDVYLVSNVNGPLIAQDGNGFISRLTPDGRIAELQWIHSGQPGVTLHGPKGMIFADDHLVVADVKAVRFFDRITGKPVRSVPVPDAYMLNDVAAGPDGTIYVTDTGDETGEHPGAVYRLGEQGPVPVASGPHLDRPDGLMWHGQGLLITPFGAHAREVYQLGLGGERSAFGTMPAGQLDGLIGLPDGSFAITSWRGDAVYRLSGAGARPTTMVAGIPSPAQIGYDDQRQRLLVPVLQKNEVRFYSYGAPGDDPGD